MIQTALQGQQTSLADGIAGARSAVDIVTFLVQTQEWQAPAANRLPVGQFQDLRGKNNLIASKPGYFWCFCHLADLPLEKQSGDPRYCQQCYEVLVQAVTDMKSSGIRRKPWWIPKLMGEKTVKVLEQPSQNMSTLNSQNITADIFQPTVTIRRGPKKKALPMELVAQLAGNGLGSKAIASRLNADGIAVSYRTIQRQKQGIMS